MKFPAPSPMMAALLNRVDEGWAAFAYAVPQRILRVTTRLDYRIARVEQLVLANRDRVNPCGTWRTLSTHNSDAPGGCMSAAMAALGEAKKRLNFKVQQKAERVVQDNVRAIQTGMRR